MRPGRSPGKRERLLISSPLCCSWECRWSRGKARRGGRRWWRLQEGAAVRHVASGRLGQHVKVGCHKAGVIAARADADRHAVVARRRLALAAEAHDTALWRIAGGWMRAGEPARAARAARASAWWPHRHLGACLPGKDIPRGVDIEQMAGHRAVGSGGAVAVRLEAVVAACYAHELVGGRVPEGIVH